MPLKRPAVPHRCAECGEWCHPDYGAWWLQVGGWPTGCYVLCFDCDAWLSYYAQQGGTLCPP